MAPKIKPAPEYIRALLSYNSKTGTLRWKMDRPPRGKKGQIAGCRQGGKHHYRLIGIDKRTYYAHILAWVIKTGAWPKEQIDHKSTDNSDNSWKNLREASHGQNKQNQTINKNNTSGYKGVYKHNNCNRWGAMIQCNLKKRHLGLFKTPQEASQAYQKAAIELHGDFARFS